MQISKDRSNILQALSDHDIQVPQKFHEVIAHHISTANDEAPTSAARLLRSRELPPVLKRLGLEMADLVPLLRELDRIDHFVKLCRGKSFAAIGEEISAVVEAWREVRRFLTNDLSQGLSYSWMQRAMDQRSPGRTFSNAAFAEIEASMDSLAGYNLGGDFFAHPAYVAVVGRKLGQRDLHRTLLAMSLFGWLDRYAAKFRNKPSVVVVLVNAITGSDLTVDDVRKLRPKKADFNRQTKVIKKTRNMTFKHIEKWNFDRTFAAHGIHGKSGQSSQTK